MRTAGVSSAPSPRIGKSAIGYWPFLAEVQRRSEADADVTIADKKMSERIAWAQQKIDSLDVFESGIAGLFEKISAPIPPTHGHWMDS